MQLKLNANNNKYVHVLRYGYHRVKQATIITQNKYALPRVQAEENAPCLPYNLITTRYI